MLDEILVMGVLALGLLAWGMLKKIPDTISKSIIQSRDAELKKQEQNRDFQIKKNLQIDNYYRSEGSSILQTIMLDWTKMLTDTEYLANRDIADLNSLIEKTIGYASSETVELMSKWFQRVYDQSLREEENEAQKTYVFLAFIVSSLKKDFSGEYVKPETLLKVKLNDFSENGELYRSMINQITEEVKINE